MFYLLRTRCVFCISVHISQYLQYSTIEIEIEIIGHLGTDWNFERWCCIDHMTYMVYIWPLCHRRRIIVHICGEHSKLFFNQIYIISRKNFMTYLCHGLSHENIKLNPRANQDQKLLTFALFINIMKWIIVVSYIFVHLQFTI